MKSIEFGILVTLIFGNYAATSFVIRNHTVELFDKFEKLLDDRVRNLHKEIGALKKQLNQNGTE